jgi:8-oxo-dGTP pyrophosphatase MutT (NUDIX family)
MPISPYIQDLRKDVGHGLLLLPGVTAVVFDDAGRLLLGERADNGRWALIAGVMDPGEQPAETIVREVYEETAVHVVPERVTSVLTQPPIVYPNGDRCEYVDITFRCRAVGGEARVNDDESLAVGWFELDDLPPLSDLVRHRIECALRPDTWFAQPAPLGSGQ